MNYNILLVDDSISFRRTLADTLCAYFATMNIVEAGSGEDALIKVEELQPDMIFMDINLPGENGLEATRIIKMRYKNTFIAMLTSYDIPEYRQQAFHNGADHFISKADDSCLRDIIAWVEKTVAVKNTSIARDSSSASRRAILLERNSGTRDCLPGARLDLAACLL